MAENKEYELIRVTVDAVVEKGSVSERRREVIAKELSDNLHTIVMEQEDAVNPHVEKYIEAHVHDTADGERCSWCLSHSKDYRNGNVVAAAND